MKTTELSQVDEDFRRFGFMIETAAELEVTQIIKEKIR